MQKPGSDFLRTWLAEGEKDALELKQYWREEEPPETMATQDLGEALNSTPTLRSKPVVAPYPAWLQERARTPLALVGFYRGAVKYTQ